MSREDAYDKISSDIYSMGECYGSVYSFSEDDMDKLIGYIIKRERQATREVAEEMLDIVNKNKETATEHEHGFQMDAIDIYFIIDKCNTILEANKE